MSVLTDLIGKDGVKTDVTVSLDKGTIINFGLAIFISLVAVIFAYKLLTMLTNKA